MKQFDFSRDPDKFGDEAITVTDRPKRKIDFWPRLCCLFLAIIVWIYVSNFDDVDVTTSVTLKLDINGTESLDDGLMIYGVDTQEVTLTVKGNNRDIKKYGAADYGVSIDVSKIESVGKHTVTISPLIPKNTSLTIVSVEPQNAILQADIRTTKQVPFNVIEGDISKVSTYEYSIEKSTDTVEISGPQKILETIEQAQYTITGDISKSMVYTGFNLELLDANGGFINNDYGIIESSTANIKVNMNVVKQAELPVVVNAMYENGEIHKINNYALTKHSVEVKGDPAVLDGITNYVITLSPEEYAAGVATHSFVAEGHLPEGVILLDEGNSVQIVLIEQPQQPET